MDSSTADEPPTTSPSTGTAEPGLTSKSSPTTTSESGLLAEPSAG
eukprot:CAMPEP_0202780990 /NCGR_PEP_ID=MMETSP1388-20130828/59780_1 /ASSEMBLY_ACC=CAM_ASM_000864 /TAXON_ID=37098 /ORGANISM="Isochrysis sp, Strain CCMP1244" /LENGTH=44 /DNA_ID= /DNA_START= /DNA_END= /DNA_ORIENTATION=